MDHLDFSPPVLLRPATQRPDVVVVEPDRSAELGLGQTRDDLPRVVLPQPDSPTSATTSSGSTDRFTSFRTGRFFVVAYLWVRCVDLEQAHRTVTSELVVDHVTGDQVPRVGEQWRLDPDADLLGHRAAGCEPAPRRQGGEVGHLPGDRAEPGALVQDARDGVDERLHVGMPPPRLEDLPDRARLDQPSRVHHRHPGRELGHDRQVVGHEDDGDPELGGAAAAGCRSPAAG